MYKHTQKTDKLIALLYILARDHLPAGKIEGIMSEHVCGMKGDKTVYSNPYLAQYAADLAGRIMDGK